MKLLACILITLALTAAALGQSSSLYVTQPAEPVQMIDGKPVNPHLQQASYLAVPIPEPRKWAVNDLVTIVVRESSIASSSSELETEKETEIAGSIEAFPRLTLADLVNAQLRPNDFEGGTPEVDVSFEKEFAGEGEYERRDEIITRITAKVLDVKPNGTLALEARTQIRSDKEEKVIIVTGYCRAEDVTVANTVLSTQIYDLRLEQEHKGEVRDATKKGILTKALETLFAF
jgi:flagellar L-ring protein precursor FlgH